ncbi:hypothetical protein [Brevundimonas diminuta]|uniref:hypothetical protein n=1 Tax=Brevundimonas diminuta TaxID=293 RepID=UPI003CFF75E2
MRLAASNLPAAQDVCLYAVPADSRAVFTVSFCNRTPAMAKVRLAMTNGEAPTDADWLEFDTPLIGFAVLERTGLALTGGQKVYARADVDGVSAVAFGVVDN